MVLGEDLVRNVKLNGLDDGVCYRNLSGLDYYVTDVNRLEV